MKSRRALNRIHCIDTDTVIADVDDEVSLNARVRAVSLPFLERRPPRLLYPPASDAAVVVAEICCVSGTLEFNISSK